jgi:peptidoglycan glycosyltransferase
VNAPLRRVAISVLVLFTLLIVNVNIIQVVRAGDLRDNPRNTRVLAEEFDRERGSIVVDGNEIALSEATDGRLRYLRQYPQGEVYAPVTGYYSPLVYGSTGMERAANRVLSGSDPRLTLFRLGDLFTGRDPAGGNVQLTLEPAVQQAAMEGLAGVTGAVVALDPTTGAILALASTPSYDPGQLSSHDPAAIRDYRAQLGEAELRNHAISDKYPPGSIFKVIVSAAALASGDYTPETTVPAPDELTLPGTSTQLRNFGNSSCNGGADQSLIDALTVSCNTAFAQLGIDLGQERVQEMAEAFGMDGEGFDMPLEVTGSSVGDIENDAQLGQSSIGQFNVAMTPMQAAMVAAAVANDGTLMKPYLVDSLQAPDLSVIDQTEPEEMSEPISSEVADQLTEMMTSVVEEGSGRRARVDGVTVAGKTGTAQVAEGVEDHNWFIGFAPADDPTIAVAVFVANGGGTGGDTSAPIAREVIEAHLAARGEG